MGSVSSSATTVQELSRGTEAQELIRNQHRVGSGVMAIADWPRPQAGSPVVQARSALPEIDGKAQRAGRNAVKQTSIMGLFASKK